MAQALKQASMSKIAIVREDKLSDGSIAYNVHVAADERYDIRQAVTIGALNKQYALDIARALNNGAAWVDVG